MSLHARLLEEREEEERRRGRTSGREEDTGSTGFPRRPENVSEDRAQDQRRTDLERMRSYLTYGVTNRFEGMHLAHLRRRYPDQFWDLRYGRL